MSFTGDELIKATGLGGTILGGFATAITWLVTRTSNSGMTGLSQDDAANIRRVVDNLVSGHTRSQVEFAEIRKDISHILEKMEHFEEHRERDHTEIKKLSRILYPLLKDEIARERKKMGLGDADDGLATAR